MANKIKTGLGREVDSLVARSPQLKTMLAQARRRWKEDFRIERGKRTGYSWHTITVNGKDSPLEQALGLAHELGHLLNRAQTPIPGGRTFEQFRERNAEAQIREEAAAVKAEIRVRQELRRGGERVPLFVGGLTKLNFEWLLAQRNEDQFLACLRREASEMTGGETLEAFWRRQYSTESMRHIYKGLHPKSLPRPSWGPKMYEPLRPKFTKPMRRSIDTSLGGALRQRQRLSQQALAAALAGSRSGQQQSNVAAAQARRRRIQRRLQVMTTSHTGVATGMQVGKPSRFGYKGSLMERVRRRRQKRADQRRRSALDAVQIRRGLPSIRSSIRSQYRPTPRRVSLPGTGFGRSTGTVTFGRRTPIHTVGRSIYTVQKRDTLWDISKRFYGDPRRWRRIYNANRSAIPLTRRGDLVIAWIRPGQRLRIPPR